MLLFLPAVFVSTLSVGGGPQTFELGFTPALNPSDLPVLDLDMVAGGLWKPGLSQRPLSDGGGDQGRFPLFAFPQLVFARNGKERVLSFPLKGVWAGAELKEPIAVYPGACFRFQARVSHKGLKHSAFYLGVFWEDGAGEPLRGPDGERVVALSSPMEGDGTGAIAVVSGRVPEGARKARPFFFLRGRLPDLKGVVRISEALFSLTPGLLVQFQRSLLLFPAGDPVVWRLRSVGLEPGTYFVKVALTGPESKVQLGETSFRTLATPEDQLRLRGSFVELLSRANEQPGLYNAAFDLTDGGGKEQTRKLQIRFALLGEEAGEFGGTLYQFVPAVSLRLLERLTRTEAFEELLEDVSLNTLHVTVPVDRLEVFSEILDRVAGRGCAVRWLLTLEPGRRRPGIEKVGTALAGLAHRIDAVEIAPGTFTEQEISALVQSVSGRRAAVPLQILSRGVRKAWAHGFTIEEEAEGTGLPGKLKEAGSARWVFIEGTGRRFLYNAVLARVAGARTIVFSGLEGGFLQLTPAGWSPTASYGLWRTLQRMLGAAAYIGPMSFGADVEAYWFRCAEGDVIVARSKKASGKAVLRTTSPVRAFDWWGGSRLLAPEEGRVTLNLGLEFRFFLGRSFGYDRTLQALRLVEANAKEGGGVLKFSIQNFLGRQAILEVSEQRGAFSKQIVLKPEGVTTFEVEVSPALALRLRREQSLTVRASLELGGRKYTGEPVAFPLFWGVRRFTLGVWKLGDRTFSFSIRYEGRSEVKGHVFVLEDGPEGSEVTANFAGIRFTPGENRTFAGARRYPGKPLQIVVLAEGGKPERFSLPPARPSLASGAAPGSR